PLRPVPQAAGVGPALGRYPRTRPVTVRQLPSSFRDPAGYVYEESGVLRRRITSFGRPSYDALGASGLYDELTEAGLLVPHEEVSSTGAELIIEPRRVSYVSYPFEWSFSQLRDAALLTLDAQRRAIARSMTLKDATAYNVQFESGRPVLIDTLSFEPYV